MTLDVSDLAGRHVTVAGLGVSGVPAARALRGLGATVTVVNGVDGERQRAEAAGLEALGGVTVRLGDGDTLPQGTELIVTTPGWKPSSPLFLAAAEAGVPVWGDVELAWRLRTEDLVRAADVEEGCRAIGFTLGTPGPSQFGVVENILVDRAFVANRQKQAQELAEVSDVNPPAPHNIANALAAAALARAFGVPPTAVRDGLRAFRPDPHRVEHVADVAGVAYVDDSKATNTHAAQASLDSFEHIVWIAGGLAKGATFDELVVASAKRLRGVVLIGQDRALIGEALTRHAADVPVVDLDRT
ncbi:glutamate ligase domain-containing protein, partial [Streptomyces sp. MCAF7]